MATLWAEEDNELIITPCNDQFASYIKNTNKQ